MTLDTAQSPELQDVAWQEPPKSATNQDGLLDAVLWICERYGCGKTPEALMAGLPKAGVLSPSLALDALANAGLTAGLVDRRLQLLPAHVMPMILLHKRAGGCILLARRRNPDKDAKSKLLYQVIMPEVGPDPVEYTQEEMDEFYSGYAILVKPTAQVDTRAGELEPEPAGHWLLRTLWRYRRYYASAALGALLINVLGLASIFFTMNVYDRVVPNQAYVTLWSLAIGVGVAMTFEAISRHVRAHLLDVAGKKADLVMGTLLFRQALSIRMENKPASAGSFANQLREYESVRDFATSATLSAISDLPFVLLFIGVVFMIGGTLGWVPALMVPLIIGISVLVQWPLAKIMKENLREASLKQGVLIESVEGLETLKAVGGEGYMQRRWEHYSGLSAASSMKSRKISSKATSLVTFLQQLQTVVLVVLGVYLIDAGELTQGALIGTVMLAGRITAPLSQVMGLALRFQQAKAALHSLNNLMAMPVDRDPAREYLPKPPLSGEISLKDVGFAYPAPPMQPNPPILKGVNLAVKPGERVAILGRIGSGKSTLLRVMARLYAPTDGQMFTDGLDVEQIDPADWRKAVGYVGQDARLFHGSLRENVMIGRPEASADEFLRVLKLTGLDQVAAKHPKGINLPIGEGGQGISGGQRQLVSLARTLLARPLLLLLDEPTSAMDSQTEAVFLDHLARATEGQTLVVVTHRPSLLALVDRIIVVEEGKVVADGPKSKILAALSGESRPAPGAARRPAANKAPAEAVAGNGATPPPAAAPRAGAPDNGALAPVTMTAHRAPRPAAPANDAAPDTDTPAAGAPAVQESKQ
ncbi:type I secretion system permease/ATPase [Burkholderia ubonensis]|uniref:type I secretion system permease/ATPase n=1 Tax=Burkholderia ubonensis TaxID=101571 RepID=UPI0009B4103A|nr:type I secretion system permease/ATPase [Burkholderia ubonensis]